jgi:hypothetical protein
MEDWLTGALGVNMGACSEGPARAGEGGKVVSRLYER